MRNKVDSDRPCLRLVLFLAGGSATKSINCLSIIAQGVNWLPLSLHINAPSRNPLFAVTTAVTIMPLREWAKKHIHKKQSDEKLDFASETVPSFKVTPTDSLGVPPLQIPTETSRSEKSGLSASSPSPSPKSPNRISNRLSRLGHRSTSQTSLPEWTPPDEADPNAERDWEARATKLAKLRPVSMSQSNEDLAALAKLSVREDQKKAAQSADGRLLPQGQGWAPTDTVDGLTSDDALQEAIRLHEGGGNLF